MVAQSFLVSFLISDLVNNFLDSASSYCLSVIPNCRLVFIIPDQISCPIAIYHHQYLTMAYFAFVPASSTLFVFPQTFGFEEFLHHISIHFDYRLLHQYFQIHFVYPRNFLHIQGHTHIISASIILKSDADSRFHPMQLVHSPYHTGAHNVVFCLVLFEI